MRKRESYLLWRTVTVSSPCCLISSWWQDRGIWESVRLGRWNTGRCGFWCRGSWTESVLSLIPLPGISQTGHRYSPGWVYSCTKDKNHNQNAAHLKDKWTSPLAWTSVSSILILSPRNWRFSFSCRRLSNSSDVCRDRFDSTTVVLPKFPFISYQTRPVYAIPDCGPVLTEVPH